MSDEAATERVVSGASWNEYCEMLKLAGNVVLSRSAPADALTRAEGFRYLSRISRAALEAFVEHADPLAPMLHRPVHETAKMGADNPDNYYQNAMISGQHRYRLRGQRNSIHYLGLGTYAGYYGSGGRSAQTGYLEGKDLRLEPDGSFEVTLSCEEQPGNWLRMEPDTGSLIVRQTFLDRQHERIAELTLERLGGDGKPTPFTAARFDQGLTAAGRLVVGAAAMFANWAEGFARHTNELPQFDPDTSLAAHGDPNIVYYHSYWRLLPDEALVVEVTPPVCDYWNFQLNNHWMESLDYRYYRIAINKHQAVYGPEGSVRIVVAHQDPGLANWLQTAGHSQGTMCFRWVRAQQQPQPRTRVVKLAELGR